MCADTTPTSAARVPRIPLPSLTRPNLTSLLARLRVHTPSSPPTPPPRPPSPSPPSSPPSSPPPPSRPPTPPPPCLSFTRLPSLSDLPSPSPSILAPHPLASSPVTPPALPAAHAAVLARARAVAAHRAGTGAGAETRGRSAPVLVGLAASYLLQEARAPAVDSDGFFNVKGWLEQLCARAMVPRWREAVWVLSEHVRWERGAGVAAGVDARLVGDAETLGAFCKEVTAACLGRVVDAVGCRRRVTANVWRQAHEAWEPINLFKIARFFAAWLLFCEGGSGEARAMVEHAVEVIRSSPGASTDEAGIRILNSLNELMNEPL